MVTGRNFPFMVILAIVLIVVIVAVVGAIDMVFAPPPITTFTFTPS